MFALKSQILTFPFIVKKKKKKEKKRKKKEKSVLQKINKIDKLIPKPDKDTSKKQKEREL